MQKESSRNSLLTESRISIEILTASKKEMTLNGNGKGGGSCEPPPIYTG